MMPVSRILMVASGSPRRRDLLESVLGTVEIDPPDINETPRSGERASELVMRLALAKASSVAERHPGRMVLGADTVVVVDDTILGKPDDRDDAAAMLRALSGRSHRVMTGVAVVCRSGADCPAASATACEVTEVFFRTLTDADIAWYLRSGEADDKAGAYGIQGKASLFVDRIIGSYQNVVGLPLSVVDTLLQSLGARLLDFDQQPCPSERVE